MLPRLSRQWTILATTCYRPVLNINYDIMKKQLALLVPALVILLSGLILPSGCSYDSGLLEPPDIPIDTSVQVSLSMDIMPLFNESCNFSGCHNVGGTPPDLTPNNTYDALWEGGYIDTLAPESSELMQWLIGNRPLDMPLTGPDPELNSLVLTWITQGAKDN